MPDRDAFLLDPAREFYDALSDEDRRHVDGMLAAICEDPFVDFDRKVAFPFPPLSPRLYSDGVLYLIYDDENPWTLAIWIIGYDDPESLIIPNPPDYR